MPLPSSMGMILSPFINVMIGDFQFGMANYAPGNSGISLVTSLTLKKLTGGVATGTVTLNYRQDQGLPNYIIDTLRNNQGIPTMKLRYGYVNGVTSPTYKCLITDMKFKSIFKWEIELSISILPTMDDQKSIFESLYKPNKDFRDAYNAAYAQIGTQTNELGEEVPIYGPGFKRLSDLVKLLTEKQGWQFDSSSIAETTEDESWIVIEDFDVQPMDLIQNLMLKYKQETEDGAWKFVSEFRVNHGETGGYKYYFVPTQDSQGNIINTQFHNYEFYMNAPDGTGQVIDFLPTLSTGQTHSAFESPEKNQSVGMISKDTNELIDVVYEWMGIPKPDPKTSISDPYNIFGSKCATVIPNKTISEASNYVSNLIKSNITDFAYTFGNSNTTAELQVIGDPILEVGDYANVIPLLSPGGDMKNPRDLYDYPMRMHPTGGTYKIREIVDSVSDSGFDSTIQLVRDGTASFNLGKITLEFNKSLHSHEVEAKNTPVNDTGNPNVAKP